VTQNYVSARNLSDVFRFLKTRPAQISGCRDRTDAIAPEHLYEAFSTKIKDYDLELWNSAMKDSTTKWMCDAWKDNDDEEMKKEERTTRKKKKKKKLSVLERAKLPSLSCSVGDGVCSSLMGNETKDASLEICENDEFTFSFL